MLLRELSRRTAVATRSAESFRIAATARVRVGVQTSPTAHRSSSTCINSGSTGSNLCAAAAAAAAAATAAAAAAVTGCTVLAATAEPLSNGKNRPLAPKHRVSIVAGVLRNASWAGDARCASLPAMLAHLEAAGYDGMETSVGDLTMMFFQDLSPEQAIPEINAAVRAAGGVVRLVALVDVKVI
jgi:hypothetical protein